MNPALLSIPGWVGPLLFGGAVALLGWLAKGRFDDVHDEVKALCDRSHEHANTLANHDARLENLERGRK